MLVVERMLTGVLYHKKKMVDKMTELSFRTPLALASFLKNFEGIAQNSNVDKSRIPQIQIL